MCVPVLYWRRIETNARGSYSEWATLDYRQSCRQNPVGVYPKPLVTSLLTLIRTPVALLIGIILGASASADTVNLTFGAIPPGQSSTVTVRAVIGGSPVSLSNQASVSGTGLAPTLSDDPGLVGAADPTVIGVAPPCPALVLQNLSHGQIGVTYSSAVGVTGGLGHYSYSISSGSLPSGLSLAASGGSAGTLSGVPSSTGIFTFTVTAIDTGSAGTCTGIKNYSLVIGSVITAGDLVIREFRTRGPAGAEDDENAGRGAKLSQKSILRFCDFVKTGTHQSQQP